MTITTFRAAILSKPGPYILRLDDGSSIEVPHIDYLSLPGPTAEPEQIEPIIVVWGKGGLQRILDLTHLVSVDLVGQRRPSNP